VKLREKEEYSFRVSAINEVGRGEPSRPTPNLTIGEQPNQPKIDLSGVRDIKVRASEDFSVNINYTGHPKPTAQFWCEDKELCSSTRIHIQVTEEFVSIIVKNSSKTDAGQYRLKLMNDSGYDTATFNVTVLDRPGPPRLIYATDFAGESFNLNWSSPVDTGGSPITNYIVEKCEVGKSYQKVSSYITTNYTRIRNLVVNNKYDFKIFAENQYGISDPAVTDEPITAKHPFDPPGAPGQPRDLSSTADSITIQWTRPRNDGGSPIMGYYIEKRMVGGGWTKACHSMINDLTHKITGLTENSEYEFRIAAVNLAGQGPWSAPSDPIRCSPAKCAPKITSDLSLRDMTIIAGQEMSITVPFMAIPQPKQQWSINGYEVYADARISLEINSHEARFYNKKAKRSDTGTYNIQLTNSEGSDQGSCKVLVVDRPSPPQKPFDSYDITPETCTLSWRPPQDDGGSNITNYVVEMFDCAGGFWTKICSFVRGIQYDVIGLEPNKKYNFRIRAENQYGLSDGLELEEPITAKFPFTVPDPPGKPKAVGESTTAVNLTWDRPYSDGGSKIQGYKVEYRDVSESIWISTTGSLVKSQSYTVCGLTTGHTYEFQIKATNAAGDSRPSAPSGSFELKAKSNPPGPPGTPIVTKIGKNFVDLKWTASLYDGGSKITGYIIEARESSGMWFRCNDYNVTDLEYTCIDLTTHSEYEFRIIAVNSAGKSDPSPPSGNVKVCEFADGTEPEFIKGLQNCNVGLGKRLELSAEVTGKPDPKARWMKNGRDVTEQPGRVSFESKKKGGSTFFMMIVEEIWEIDDGEYTCQAYNSMGFTNSNCRLRVGAPPRIEYIPSELHLPEGDNTKIKIKWSGDMPFIVKIFRNGDELVDSTRVKMTLFDEFLIIFMRDITKEDAGKYTVKVTNESGCAEESFMVYISGLPGAPIGPLIVSEITSHTCKLAWNPPEFDGGSRVTHYIVERRDVKHNQWIIIASFCKSTSFSVQGLTEGQEYLFRILAANVNGSGPPLDGVNPIRAKPPHDPPSAPGKPTITSVGGDFVNLDWDKPEQDGGSRIKGYWIEKREVGLELWQRVNQYMHSATQFNITNLIEGRSYEFRIFAENEIGLSEPSMNSQQVVAKDPDEPQPPQIIAPLKDISVIEDRQGKLECKITGVPKPKVTWYKGARELFDSAKHEITVIGNVYYLTVNDVFGEDEDTYTCRASNTGGTKSSKCELKIKQPARLNVPPRFRDSAFFDKGENGIIKIPFTGNPKPRITWKKESEFVESGAHFTVKTEERHALLTIMDCSKDDSGPYSITAENELGTDYAIINVQVSDRPDPPRWPQTSQIGTDSLVLEWQVPNWDGGSSITNYIVEKQELPMTGWCRVGHTRFGLIPVTGLTPGNEYKFRVFAENVYGRSDPSDESGICQTKGIMTKKTARTQYKIDPDTGKKIRGQKCEVKDYDQFVFDIYAKYIPQPVEIKTQDSVYDHYDILEEIGTGAFGVVHRCRELKTSHVYAAKFIPIGHAMEKALIRKEIDIMNHLHHCKLINLHDAFEDEDEMVLIFEFLSGGELFERITAEGYTMSEAEVINYMRQICEGVKHMHERNIIHLDIKPENVMCTTSKSTSVKIIDFGLATKLDPNELVKISTGTAEFAAPEIVEREAVGFYTDMWAVGVLSYVLLSGLSPFAGASDIETLKNVKACDWSFDEEAFKNVSEEGRDFIRKLLIKQKEKRLSAHECLLHPWLTGDHSHKTLEIARNRFFAIREKIRKKYANWNEFVLPMGRMSEFSSLRKLQMEKYRMQEVLIDRKCAAPRFVIKPQSTFGLEGQSARFTCRIISLTTASVSWYHNNTELRQSVKYMKRYIGDDYTFIINRCKLEDRGEFIIRAENHYGVTEEPVFLNVQPTPKDLPRYEPEPLPVRKRELNTYKLYKEEKESSPMFSFHLRPRVMQEGATCKLLACCTGNPHPAIKWLKGGKELDPTKYPITHTDGVITIEIINCQPGDSGKYRCVASNALGSDSTECVVIVEDWSPGPMPGQ